MTIYGMAATALATFSAVAYSRFTAVKIIRTGKTNYMSSKERLEYCLLRGVPIAVVLMIVIWIIAWIDK